MRERQRSLTLILIMAGVAISVGGVILAILYQVELSHERARLAATAQSQARLIEAVARHETLLSSTGGARAPEEAVAATLNSVQAAM